VDRGNDVFYFQVMLAVYCLGRLVQWFAVSTQLRFVDSYHMASSICLLRRFAPCSQGSWLNAAGFTDRTYFWPVLGKAALWQVNLQAVTFSIQSSPYP